MWVADRGNKRIQAFEKDTGAWLGAWDDCFAEEGPSSIRQALPGILKCPFHLLYGGFSEALAQSLRYLLSLERKGKGGRRVHRKPSSGFRCQAAAPAGLCAAQVGAAPSLEMSLETQLGGFSAQNENGDPGPMMSDPAER